MSAGNNGAGMPPEHDDDPFASLYRPDGDAPPEPGGQPGGHRRLPPQPSRQSSYHQVRPVGERTFTGQRPPAPQEYRQPQPDAYYAAPETQPGGPGPGPGGRRRAPEPEPPRRNGLLIGAIAVVLAVVVGVGAAILFSGDESKPQGDGDPTSDSQDAGGTSGGPSPSGDDDTPPEQQPEDLPAADLAQLELGGTALLETNGTVTGASSPDGSYITGLNSPGASITWTFDLEGEAGQYYLYTTYSVISDGQTMAFSVNGDPRDDPIDLVDWATATDAWEDSWVRTYNFVDLEPGTNTITMSCVESCEALIDQIYLTTEKEE